MNKIATNAEKEVERLLKTVLLGTPWSNKIKAVGGYPRDQYLGIIKNDPSIEAKDLDLLVDNIKDGADNFTHFMFNKFKHLKPVPISEPRQMGKGYPIWQITFKENINFENETYATKGAIIEVADTMKESYPDPKSRQRKVEPADLQEDIKRRDLAINMLLKDMTTGDFEDITGISKHDIEHGILRGHPKVSMNEILESDPIRILRIFRFYAKYGWKIPKPVLRSIQHNADRIKIVSIERIMEEFKKIAGLGKLREAIKLMGMTGILKILLPEIEALKGIKQNPEWHEEDVYHHTLMVLKNAPPGIKSQIAALLHDVGKPATTKLIDGKIRSLGHESVGASMAEAIMRRLSLDNETIAKVKKIIEEHMRPHDLADGSTKAIRKFIREVGDELEDILDLGHADGLGRIPSKSDIPKLRKRIEEIKNKIEIKKDAILNGKEIMELLDLKQGKEIGEVKKFLIDLEDNYAEEEKRLTKEEAKKEVLKKFKKKTSICSYLKEISSTLTNNINF